MRITLEIPDHIESSIVDGPFEGTLSIVNVDTVQPLPIQRFHPIAGVGDADENSRRTVAVHNTPTASAGHFRARKADK